MIIYIIFLAAYIQCAYKGHQMLKLILVLFLLSVHPVQARADMFTEACEGDVFDKLKSITFRYEYMPGVNSEQRAEIPRVMGVSHILCIDQLIRTAEAIDWTKFILKPESSHQVIRELHWVRDLFNSGLDEIYRQAKYYEKRAKGEKGKVPKATAENLAVTLHMWLMDKGYPPARFDYAQSRLVDKEMPPSSSPLERLANDEYMPAMLDAARRFFIGDGVEKDLGSAYYWIMRIKAARGDVSSIIDFPLSSF